MGISFSTLSADVRFTSNKVSFFSYVSAIPTLLSGHALEVVILYAAPSLRPINFCCDVHNVFGRRGGLILPG